MSVPKKDQVFPRESAATNEQFVAALIAKALREDYGELGSAVKRIGRRIGANPRAIRNWYEGRNAPNSVHLLLLAQSSPRVFAALLELIGRTDLLEVGQDGEILPLDKVELGLAEEIYGEENFTINISICPKLRCELNHRQLWFYGLLQQGQVIKAADIAEAWKVSLRTARTDIAFLVKRKVVRFSGGNRWGHYEIRRRN